MTRKLGALSLLLLLAGCGGGESASEQSREQAERTEAAKGLPTCDAPPMTAPPPAAFPRTFPLPSGTVITSAQRLPQNGASIQGVVPLSLKRAAAYFTKRVPAAGFTPGVADSEPWEAESEFSGNGLEGKWKVNELPGCAEKAALLVAVAEK